MQLSNLFKLFQVPAHSLSLFLYSQEGNKNHSKLMPRVEIKTECRSQIKNNQVLSSTS